jgi:hypothetical protein
VTATDNPRLRLILLLGLLAAAALGAGMLFMSRSAATSEDIEAPLPPLRRAAAPARPVAAPKPATPAQVAAKPKPVGAKAKPAAKPVPASAPKPKPTVAANGLPLSIAQALTRNPVVVVSLVVPNASVDELARAEAEAGARDAGAGFVTVNVLDEKQGGPLAKKLGVLEAPAVLVYRRPDTLFVQLEGFADRETVAQAAANARS